MKKFIFFSFCFIALSTFAQKEKIKVTDLLNVKTVSSVTLSNDASKVAFSVLSIEPDAENKGEYKYVNQIWITAADGSTSPKQLTTQKEGSAQPAFSPDGKQIAFVRLADGKPQIFLLSK